MPRADYKTCRRCRRPTREVGSLSHTRLCGSCAVDLELENIAQMEARDGPNFLRWRVGMILAAGVGGVDVLAALSHSGERDA